MGKCLLKIQQTMSTAVVKHIININKTCIKTYDKIWFRYDSSREQNNYIQTKLEHVSITYSVSTRVTFKENNDTTDK